MSPTNVPARPILVTGTAGFIGFHVARRLLEQGHDVVGLDGFTSYYDVQLKHDRHAILSLMPRFRSEEFMLEDSARLGDLVQALRPAIVIHLAAQAGVRYSIENPRAYVDSNIVGTFNLLEACRATPPAHLLIASTSSVYGNAPAVPFKETSESSQPVSLYAATKKATEVLAHSYAQLYGLPITAFRFFTVYGPWGRPDMALFKFTDAILADREIEVYGEGKMSRDFTFIDDLVAGIVGLIGRPPPAASAMGKRSDATSPVAPFRVVNIGASRPVGLEDFIAAIETALGRKARRRLLPMQPGDVQRTYADVTELRSLVDMPPPTPLAEGVGAFVEWYRDYYAARLAPAAE
ncbi:NAD-dependent epimerase [soil metagenome]